MRCPECYDQRGKVVELTGIQIHHGEGSYDHGPGPKKMKNQRIDYKWICQTPGCMYETDSIGRDPR